MNKQDDVPKKMSIDNFDEDDIEDNDYGDVNEKSSEGSHLLDQIDHYALRIFPLFFLAFNLAYWGLYLFIMTDSK